MELIHVVITMDCEPVRPTGGTMATSGPESYGQSAAYTEAFAGCVADHGFPVSFFIHPETALAHPGLFLELESKGACLGLHIHPYKIERTRFQNHFGALNEFEQTVLISESTARWQSAIGRRPLYFRPGTFSANDATFKVLTRLGFRGGSLSCPGRVYPDLYAAWAGTPLDPHFGHDTFRLMPGDLDFVNLPLSVDTSHMEMVKGRSFYRDLRPDYLEADYDSIANNMVRQLRERQPAVPILMVVTHNDNDFTCPDDRVRRNLERSLSAIQNACDRADVTAQGATVESVCDLVRERIDRVKPDFVLGHASIQAGK